MIYETKNVTIYLYIGVYIWKLESAISSAYRKRKSGSLVQPRLKPIIDVPQKPVCQVLYA